MQALSITDIRINHLRLPLPPIYNHYGNLRKHLRLFNRPGRSVVSWNRGGYVRWSGPLWRDKRQKNQEEARERRHIRRDQVRRFDPCVDLYPNWFVLVWMVCRKTDSLDHAHHWHCVGRAWIDRHFREPCPPSSPSSPD